MRTWRGKFDHLAEAEAQGQYSLTMREFHHSFALFLFSFSVPVTQNAWGHENGEKPKMAWRQTENVGSFAEFDRVWPVAGLTLALIAIISSIGLLGYVAIKLL